MVGYSADRQFEFVNVLRPADYSLTLTAASTGTYLFVASNGITSGSGGYNSNTYSISTTGSSLTYSPPETPTTSFRTDFVGSVYLTLGQTLTISSTSSADAYFTASIQMWN